MKENRNNVIQVNFRDKGKVQENGMYIDEFMDLLVNTDSEILIGGYAEDYQDFLKYALNISLEEYYANMPEEKLTVEKIIERDNGAEWHYINNDNGLLKVSDFYNIEERINRKFQCHGIKLKKVLEIESFIILIYEECEISIDEIFDEGSYICTEQEFKEYMNDKIFQSLSEERKKYLVGILGERK